MKKIGGKITFDVRTTLLITTLLLSTLFLSARCASAKAEKTLVRVGYASLPGFLYTDASGNYTGFAYELLQEIATYNNWEYEYIESSYSQAAAMLESGEIDIFIPYQKTPEREAVYEYSKQPFCTNQASLLTYPESELYFNDFSHFNDITIGVQRGTRNAERFEEYLNAQGCTVSIRNDFTSLNEMKSALDSREIDAFISASNRGVENCKIICMLDATNSYVLAKKNNRELLDQLDSSLEKIQRNTPLFVSNLEEKFRISENGSFPALTREETDYISEKKTVTVMVSSDEVNPETGRFNGSIGQVLDLIASRTGLEFSPVTRSSTAEILDDFSAGSADIIFSFDSDYHWAQLHNAWLTSDYATFNCILIQRSSASSAPETVAVVKGSYIEYYVKNYTSYSTIECASYQDGIDLVQSGKADAAICNSLIGNYYATFPKYINLSFSTMFDFSSNYCIAVSQSSDNILVDILSKAVASIPSSKMNSYFESQVYSRPVSFTDYFYENPKIAIAAVLLMVTVVFVMIFTTALTASTRKKNRQLIAANNAKTDFLSRMSHDMRTPMNGIIGLARLSTDEDDPSVLKQNISKIEESGNYLLSLINDTLDMSKIENRKLVLSKTIVSASSLIGSITDMIASSAQEKGVIFTVTNINADFNSFVSIDPVRMKQIFMNLLSNAIKFTPAGGHVDLIIERMGRSGAISHTRFIVRDNGIGMSEDFVRNSLFKPFSQEQNQMTTVYTGTGLGLSIVKSLVELMGGTIEVKSRLGKGSEFTLYLDCEHVDPSLAKAQHAEESAKQKKTCHTLSGRHILLCEDHPLNREIAVKLLTKASCIVDCAVDGKCALEQFSKADIWQYDAILMDVRMPVMDGLEATRAIRALDRADAKDIPVIAITANAFCEDIEACLSSGMNIHLSKPINPTELYNTLSEQIELSDRNRSI